MYSGVQHILRCRIGNKQNKNTTQYVWTPLCANKLLDYILNLYEKLIYVKLTTSTLNTQIHGRSLSRLGTSTLIKGGGIKLVVWYSLFGDSENRENNS